MSAANDFGVPGYAKPSMDDIKKAFPNGVLSISDQLKAHIENDIMEIKKGLGESTIDWDIILDRYTRKIGRLIPLAELRLFDWLKEQPEFKNNY